MRKIVPSHTENRLKQTNQTDRKRNQLNEQHEVMENTLTHTQNTYRYSYSSSKYLSE